MIPFNIYFGENLGGGCVNTTYFSLFRSLSCRTDGVKWMTYKNDLFFSPLPSYKRLRAVFPWSFFFSLESSSWSRGGIEWMEKVSVCIKRKYLVVSKWVVIYWIRFSFRLVTVTLLQLGLPAPPDCQFNTFYVGLCLRLPGCFLMLFSSFL